MEKRKILLEVCCGSVDDVIESEKAGADRVELNSAIFFGGLTPTLGAVLEAKKRVKLPVMVMIRPRGGGFNYTETEFAAMEKDTELAVAHGADGIVFGILHADGTIDQKRCARLVALAKGTDIIFHRAIDVVPDLLASLDILADLGVERVLTTGQAATVEAGLPVIKKMVDYSRGRLEIMPGGGTPLNARQLVAESGCDQVHMAAFRTVYDTSTAARPSITYGFSLYPPEDRYELASQAVINDVRRALD